MNGRENPPENSYAPESEIRVIRAVAVAAVCCAALLTVPAAPIAAATAPAPAERTTEAWTPMWLSERAAA